MMKYIDLIAYPLMVGIVYLLLGLMNWNRDPETWSNECRIMWMIWAVSWGYILAFRIRHESK